MKVLILNGSPGADGNTTIAINEMVRIFEEEFELLKTLIKISRD